MGMLRDRAVIWCAGVLVLAACTGTDAAAPPGVPATATVSASSAPAGAGAPGTPTSSSTDATTKAAAPPRAGSAASASATAAAPRPTDTPVPRRTGPAAPAPAQPDQPSGIPAPAADPAAQFRECVEEYGALTAALTVSASVTPVVIEGWAEAYQAAASRAAEGDYAAAAAQCSQLVASIERATG